MSNYQNNKEDKTMNSRSQPPPGRQAITQHQNHTKINHQQKTQKTGETVVKKDRKKQEDRLLKLLPLQERRRQQQMRKAIMNDPLFQLV